MTIFLRFIFSFLFFLGLYGHISAQKPPTGVGSGQTPKDKIPTFDTSSIRQKGSSPDSTVYNYVYVNDIYKTYSVKDTLADITFLRSVYLQPIGAEYLNTGNLGSASVPLLFDPKVETNLTSGYNQYDLYSLTSHNFKFFEQNRPLTDLYYSQLGTQDNLNVKANFSRNFKDGLTVSLNYKRLSQKGVFAGQAIKNTNFGFGLRYKSKTEKLNSFLIFIQNANEEGHIGGVINEGDLSQQFKRDIPTILSAANTRQQRQEIAWINYYNLNAKTANRWQLYLKNDLVYWPAYYKFSDVETSESKDSTFYSLSTVDSRGLRRYLSFNQLTNHFFIHGSQKQGLQGKVGLALDYFNMSDGPLSNSRLDMTATADLKIPILNQLSFNAKGKLGLGSNIGSFDIGGDINLNFQKLGNAALRANIYRSVIPYNFSFLVVNDEIVYENEYSQPFGTSFGGSLEIPSLKMSVSAAQHVINNPLYWSEFGKPAQYDGLFSATTFTLKHFLKIGGFHFDNQANAQLFSQSIMPLPRWFSSHQLYYSGRMFSKVMDFSVGLDARIIPEFSGVGFQPLTGSFHLSPSVLPMVPGGHFFFLARVSSFRAVFVMENVSQYIINKPNFDVNGHPLFDPTFRLGFQWLLKD